MTVPYRIPKKLIEVALPLDAINAAAAREKSIRHGHPSTLHLWWARRPLAAARAVLFAQLVNDPGYERHLGRGVNKQAAEAERKRLFGIIERLVQWENTTNEAVLEEARAEIRKSWEETCRLNKDHPRAAELFDPTKLPEFHDPFAGGGAIPLEAQRLGLVAHASDLNPVAVTINKAMIEIPPKFAGRAPVGPLPAGETLRGLPDWSGAKGLAEDVRRWGHWMRERALQRIGHLYPKVRITPELAAERPDLAPLVGQELTVIAWLWARTVKSPNPAFSHVDVPLASTFVLSSKEGKQAYVEPVIEGDAYRFSVRVGEPPAGAKDGTKLARGANFRCVLSGSPIEPAYIKAEGTAARMGTRLMAIVAEGARGRIYLPPTAEHEAVTRQAEPGWCPETPLPDDPRNFWTLAYGLTTFGDLFTPRQLVALTTFSDLVREAIEACEAAAGAAGMARDGVGLEAGGTGARGYAEAVGVYLAFAVDRVIDRHSSVATWDSSPSKLQLRNTFARQAIPMTWDFGEGNPFCESSGTWSPSIGWVAMAIDHLPAAEAGGASQMDASSQSLSKNKVVSTDPPYYDNIGYADLSDFFYVWLRKTLKPVYSDLYATIAVPKVEELVATPYRHGGKEEAERFFLTGMTQAIRNMAQQAHPASPVTIYYAFKQSETKDSGTSSTGWETFLQAVLDAGFGITGTWPMRTELANRMIGSGTNALASSVVLVCQRRPADAPTCSRRDFLRELRATLPEALYDMTLGAKDAAPIAPVDLAQAAIGPGMAIFSRYRAVLDASGQPMPVKAALALINREIDVYFNQADGELDVETRFCLDWFAQHGWKAGEYGVADTLARAKGTAVDGLARAGVVEAAQGKVRLLKPAEYPGDWDPADDDRIPAWEALHHLVRAFRAGGDGAAAALLGQLGAREEALRTLAFRLYTDCERKGWAEDARGYNDLAVAWDAIQRRLEALRAANPAGQLSFL
jgi:putative DNA methylase